MAMDANPNKNQGCKMENSVFYYKRAQIGGLIEVGSRFFYAFYLSVHFFLDNDEVQILKV